MRGILMGDWGVLVLMNRCAAPCAGLIFPFMDCIASVCGGSTPSELHFPLLLLAYALCALCGTVLYWWFPCVDLSCPHLDLWPLCPCLFSVTPICTQFCTMHVAASSVEDANPLLWSSPLPLLLDLWCTGRSWLPILQGDPKRLSLVVRLWRIEKTKKNKI